MKAWKNKQRGIGMMGVILIVAVLIITATLGLKVIPAYTNDAKIVHIFHSIIGDPEMQSASDKDIRTSFTKRSGMDGITELSSDDILIDKESGRLVLSASYRVKIPLVANASLVLEFNPTSAK